MIIFRDFVLAVFVICFFLWAGDQLSNLTHRVAYPIPGPVIGMVLMFGSLVLKIVPERIFKSVSLMYQKYLGLLFIPPGVGVMAHFEDAREHAAILVISTVVSTLLVLLVTGRLIQPQRSVGAGK